MKPTQQNQAQNSAGSNLVVITGSAGSVAIADVAEVQDRYAEAIVRGNADLYDALEIHGVRDQLAGTGAGETCFEVDNENPELFSVYVHSIDDGIDAVGDFSCYDHAEGYAVNCPCNTAGLSLTAFPTSTRNCNNCNNPDRPLD